MEKILAYLAGVGFACGLVVHTLDCFGFERPTATQERVVVSVIAAIVFLPAAAIMYVRSLDKPIRTAFAPSSLGWHPRMMVATRLAFLEYMAWFALVIIQSTRNGRAGAPSYYTNAMMSSLPLTFLLVAFATYKRRR